MKMQSFQKICLALAALVVSPALAHEETEILVGRNAAGELKAHLDFVQPVELEASIFPGISGYATGELAFHSTILDEPDEDLFQLSTAADFRFILLAKDPGMEVWNDTGSAFMQTNETFYVGPSPFDTHPIWNLVNGAPGSSYSLTLKLRDLNGIYLDSEPFVLSFSAAQIHYQLDLRQVDPLHATLSWATNAVGWELQSAAFLTTTNWATITNVPGVMGTNFSLNISTVGEQQFFRLRKL